MNAQIDVRAALPAIRVPTLVMQSSRDRVTSPANGEYLAAHIPGARYALIDSDDHLPWFRDPDAVLAPVSEFVAGATPLDGAERQLATVLFTDIVDSTRRAAELGDRDWQALLARHDALARSLVERHRGRWIKSTGDGMLATFDGPARGVRCALALLREWRELGLTARAGLHTGECDLSGTDVGGIAVHIGARIAALAGPGEVIVSSTVRDLVAGSGLRFDDRGEHALKGLDGAWRTFAASAP
jgi:class 3 adenylate cyclase